MPTKVELASQTWRCKCMLTLPNWGTKTVDGYLRCDGCKRVWTLDMRLIEDAPTQ